MNFIAATKEEQVRQGVSQYDFILLTPDAYVDHPSFANALIARWVEHLGASVAIIAQPDFKDTKSVTLFGKPKYAFLISGGNLDGLVNTYTANKHLRNTDEYSEGGKAGKRPKRPTITYTSMVKAEYPDVPVIIGGIESSLRRFAHYDYWDDTVRRSILLDAKADLLIYGMGEAPLCEIVLSMLEGKPLSELRRIRGTCFVAETKPKGEFVLLPPCEEVQRDKKVYNQAFALTYANGDYITAKTLVQKHGDKYLIQNPPAKPLSTREMDTVYSLPFTRKPHPKYKERIPALDEVEFSITANRGCFGGCAFCAISMHQGKHITHRSERSILHEATELTKKTNFKGYIHDIGGPTANFFRNPCNKSKTKGYCKEAKCLSCKNLSADHTDYVNLLKKVRSLPGVKKVFIRSGIRYDYLMQDSKDIFLHELVKHHVSGQLKVAPEYSVNRVLQKMNKPNIELYNKFAKRFSQLNMRYNKKQYLIPYYICSHPGAGMKEAIEHALFLKQNKFIPEQVQDFYPTPGTLSTAMYYTGFHPLTGEKVYVAKSEKERAEHRALMQFHTKKNKGKVKEILIREGREDLIGRSERCLIDG